MRNRSPAKIAASSPPVPARTSRNRFASSSGSFGTSCSEHLPLERGEPPGELLVLVLGERAHLGIGARAQLRGGGDVALELSMDAEIARDLVEARVFLRQVAEPVLVGDRRRITEQPRDLLVPLDQLHELGAQRLLHLLAVS